MGDEKAVIYKKTGIKLLRYRFPIWIWSDFDALLSAKTGNPVGESIGYFPNQEAQTQTYRQTNGQTAHCYAMCRFI
ncbi:MAG: hypothetical protein DHS20C18_43190 [Saprospiraceae bacterium]|nr:MAG: hypothetical protein DHS20C18_43190 [Saprospiraceae bacterium]